MAFTASAVMKVIINDVSQTEPESVVVAEGKVHNVVSKIPGVPFACHLISFRFNNDCNFKE